LEAAHGDLLRWNSGIPTPQGEDLPGERPTKVVTGSDVEPELDDVAVLDDVFLAFDAEFACFAGFGLGSLSALQFYNAKPDQTGQTTASASAFGD